MDKTLERALDIISSYLEENKDPNTPVIDYKTPDELRKVMDFRLGDSSSIDELFPTLEKYLRYSVRTGHEQFVNQLYTGTEMPGILGDLIQSVTNTSMATYEISPVAVMMEFAVMRQMSKIVGFENGEGIFCTGGSNANFLAMLAARQKLFPQIKDDGYIGMKPLAFFVSDQAHYSFIKSANTLGIGQKNLVAVKSDETGKMIPEALEGAIITAQDAGTLPFFVAATAGTTVLGAFDPIPEINEIAKRYDMWLHVDAAYGCPVLFSKKHRHLLEGCELADSLTWDFHKVLSVPLISSVILLKEQGNLFSACSSNSTEYLFHEHEHSRYDTGAYSLQCGRKIDGLKTWLMWKHYGDEGFERHIDNLMDLAQYATRIIEKHPDLELLNPTNYLAINFRYNPGNLEDINKTNLTIRQTLIESGKAMVNYSWLGDEVTIRLVLGNINHTEDSVARFFQKFLKVAESV